jgi:predicted membrane protein
LNESWLLWGLLFGSVGLGFFVYGKKQRAVVPLVCGLVLMIFPYFVSNTLLLVVIGIVLMAIPYFVRI